MVGVALAIGVPGSVPAAADPPQGTATAAVLTRSVPVGLTVQDLVRTSTSVLALGTAGGRVVVARLDPGTLRVTAKAYLPESQHDGLLTAARGRVLLAVSGPHPRLVVLRERDLGLVEEVALRGQPSFGANVAGVGDMAVVGLLQGGVVAVDLHRARVAHSARLEGTDVNVAAATGSVVAVAAGTDQIGLDPFVLDPTTLAVRRRAATHVGYVQGMVGRDDTVWVTGAGGPTFVAGTPVDLSGGRRVQATVGNQIPHGVIYVPGEHTRLGRPQRAYLLRPAQRTVPRLQPGCHDQAARGRAAPGAHRGRHQRPGLDTDRPLRQDLTRTLGRRSQPTPSSESPTGGSRRRRRRAPGIRAQVSSAA